jgi:cation diffusion facilitator family transporter
MKTTPSVLELTEEKNAGRSTTLVSVAVNIVLTVSQFAAGIYSGSQALVADGIHSLSDLVSDFVVLFAGHHSKKAADADHAYGHRRYENAASLILGGLLLLVGVGMLWAALQKIQAPHNSQPVHTLALWMALTTLAAKESLFRYMFAVATRLRSGMLIANAWHARSDAASSLVVALGIGGNLMGFAILDPIAALIVGLLVSRMGVKFFWNALQDLMDRAVSVQESEAIERTLLGTPGILGLHDLRTRKMGDLVSIDVHLEVNATLTVAQGHDILEEAGRRVKEQHDVLDVMTHMDPRFVDSGRVADHPIDQQFLNRWSPRAFTGEEISEETVLTFLEAARWAPSSSNSQPWRFVFARRGTPHWDRLFGLLDDFNRSWAHSASALLIVISKHSYIDRRGKEAPAPCHTFDTGTAWGYLALQASLSGWHAHGMAGFDREKAVIDLGVPAGYTVEAAVAIGKRGDKKILPEGLQSIEAPNGRRPVAEFVFEGLFKA